MKRHLSAFTVCWVNDDLISISVMLCTTRVTTCMLDIWHMGGFGSRLCVRGTEVQLFDHDASEQSPFSVDQVGQSDDYL